MSASTNDLYKKVGTGTVTTLAAPGKALGATSINVGSTANMPTTTGIVIAIRTVDSNGELVAGTYTEWSATVASATSLAIVAVPVYGNDQAYTAGSTTQVFIPASSYAQNTLIDGILVSHNQDGTIKDGIITTANMEEEAWTAYTPSTTGFSGTPTTTDYRYQSLGKRVDAYISISGTSNATTLTFALPVASKTAINAWMIVVDNSTVQTTPGQVTVPAGSSTATVNKVAGTAGGWTNSGTKAVYGTLVYEAA